MFCTNSLILKKNTLYLIQVHSSEVTSEKSLYEIGIQMQDFFTFQTCTFQLKLSNEILLLKQIKY
jgi:hypothetical protein